MKTLTSAVALSVLTLAGGNASAADRPGVERNVAQFLQSLEGGATLDSMTPVEARAALAGAQAAPTVALPAADVSEKTIRVSGGDLKLTIVRPAGSQQQTLPAFMYFHGGGWVLGDYPTHARLIRDLVVGSGAVAVYVDYTPSPEAHYPTAINQAYAATRWVAEHGKEINVDSTRLAVAGNSVGGNMAAVVALKAKEQNTPKLRFQLLLWPVTDANFDTPSYKQYAEGHFLTKNMMSWFWDSYTTDAKQRAEIYASPLRATQAQLTGLPPALVQTAGLDVLRDEGEAYARKLDAAGVDVTAVRYNGMIHDYGLLNPLSNIPEVKAAMRQAAGELKAHLN